MPKLSIFAPCENVILGQDNNASLIIIISQLKLSLGPDVPDPIPTNVVLPMKWFLYSQWEIEEADVGVQFEQKIDFVDAQGAATQFQVIGQFTTEVGKPIHRMVAGLGFFPLIPDGRYRLRVSLRRVGEERWITMGDQMFNLLHERAGVRMGQ